MNTKLRYGLVLLVIAAVAGLVLSTVNSFTAPVIAQAQFEASVEAYREIYGDQADDFEPMDEAKKDEIIAKVPNIADIFIAKKGGEVIGYGINFTANGYGGEMINAVGLLNDKTIAGFKNIQNSETPGIGTQIENPEYAASYPETSFEAGKVEGSATGDGEGEVMMISGATVSSTGILNSLNEVLANYDLVAESEGM